TQRNQISACERHHEGSSSLHSGRQGVLPVVTEFRRSGLDKRERAVDRHLGNAASRHPSRALKMKNEALTTRGVQPFKSLSMRPAWPGCLYLRYLLLSVIPFNAGAGEPFQA